jgi:thioredoxin-related protein
MKKAILSLLTWSLPFLLMAQHFDSAHRDNDYKGIKWVQGLSWEQVKQRAKAENKYIFLDCFTTWCGPCKMMDKYVYPNDTVSDFFNQHFIAVKAQMDKTDKDEQVIKDWYNDASSIEREYAVTTYPSLIFLSPQSTILYKIEGYRPVQKFVDTAKLVLTNGTVYNDPYKEYKVLVNEYKQGIKHYDRMPYMIRTAGSLNDNDLAREIFKDHLNHTSALSENQRYTKENIELWSSFVLKLDSKALQFFLKDHRKIDQIMGEKGWSTGVVNATIQGRIVDSFFKMQKGETTTVTGAKIPNSEIMFMRLPIRRDGKIKPDYVEADWNGLEKMIRKHFSKEYTIRNVLLAKRRWYGQHQNMASLVKTYFYQLDKYPPVDLTREFALINQRAWDTFLYINENKLLRKALEWMEKIILHGTNDAGWLDTYANLLYKLGRTKDAVVWQEKAVKLNPNTKDQSFSNTLEQMKKGKPTYLDQGAIWIKEKYF